MDVYAIRFGKKIVAGNRAFHLHPDPPASVELGYFLWVVATGSRVILVDTGFREDVARRRGIAAYVAPASALSALGFSAADITDLVLSHLHYDHAGLVGDYPLATIHVRGEDLAFYTSAAMMIPEVRRSVEADDIGSVARAAAEGRVLLVSTESAELVPGVILHHMAGHSPGMQAVEVATNQGPYILASDVAHLYENLRSRSPFSIFHDFAATYASLDRLTALAGTLERVIPGHDPAVMERFPQVSAKMAGLAVRLA